MFESLMEFDLTRQEAAIYMLLYSNPNSTGYELAKLSGISRSNTYAALSSLTDKGAARLMEGLPNRYVPVPAEEFCSNRISNLKKNMEFIIRNMPTVADPFSEGYLTVQGEQNIIDTARHMLANTSHRAYMSLSDSLIEYFSDDLRKLADSGKKVVLITGSPFSVKGVKTYFSPKPGRQIRLITDSHKVLTGDLEHGRDSTCLFSGKKNLVDVFKESLQNEIRLVELKENKSEK